MLREGNGHLAASPDQLPDDAPMDDLLVQWYTPVRDAEWTDEHVDRLRAEAVRQPRRYEGADEWEPGRPLWHHGRGGYVRRLVEVLPSFPPEYRRGKWWCHACDVTWFDGKAEPVVNLPDDWDPATDEVPPVDAWSPCWLCGELAAHWDMPEEAARRKAELKAYGGAW